MTAVNGSSLLKKILTYGDQERVALLKDLTKSDDLELIQEAYETFLKTASEPWEPDAAFVVHRLAVALSYNRHTTVEQLMTMVKHTDVSTDLRVNLIRYAGTHNRAFLRALVDAEELPPLLLEQDVYDAVLSSPAVPFEVCEKIIARPNPTIRQLSMYMQHHAIPIDRFMDFRVPLAFLSTGEGQFVQEDWEAHCTYRQDEVVGWMRRHRPELLELPFEWACKLVSGAPMSVA